MPEADMGTSLIRGVRTSCVPPLRSFMDSESGEIWPLQPAKANTQSKDIAENGRVMGVLLGNWYAKYIQKDEWAKVFSPFHHDYEL